jgi:hypothetical protein
MLSLLPRRRAGHGCRASRLPKHGGRTIRVGPADVGRCSFLADGKEPDERIIAITDERIAQILTAATAGSRSKEEALAALAVPRARVARRQSGAPTATFGIRSVMRR